MKEESLLLLSDLQKLINQVVLIDYTIIILGGIMMVETKEISELTRSNRIAMLSHISTVTVMVFFMIWESVRGQLSPVYMTIATVVGVIPLIGEVICWKSNTEHAMIKHLVSYGFSLFYTICLFTSPTNLILSLIHI